MNETMAVIGLGYVGLPLALLAQQKGFQVMGIDYDSVKVKLINKGKSPFADKELSRQLQSGGLSATTSYSAVSNRGTVIVCVPTPVDDSYTPDLTPVINACTQLARNLVEGTLVIIESTVNPGVCDEIILPILEQNAGLICGKDFFLAHCPERINPGDAKWNVSNIARVVGGYNQESLDRAMAFYRKLLDADVRPMASLKEAEAVKVVENSFRDINIAFVNELAMSFSKLDIDVVNVINGAATKPFAFMPHYPGVGVGGHCIPVDPYYLIEHAKKKGFHHKFLSMAREINNRMPYFAVQKTEELLRQAGKPIEHSQIAILGLSYKANVGDMRESPSLVVARLLEEKGAKVIGLDPYIEKAEGIATRQTTSKATTSKAVAGCDAVILATAHEQYRSLDAAFFAQAGIKAVVDGRNCFEKADFEKSVVLYCGIGR